MFEVTGIDHVVLRTTHLDAMIAFYRDVLGCVVERELPPATGLVQLRAGNALIDIVTVDSELGRRGGEAPTPTGNNMDHFCLQLAPISEAAIRDHLERAGIEVGEFADRYGAQGFGRSLYLQDPDHNNVELRSQL